jgi:hypothetical protein
VVHKLVYNATDGRGGDVRAVVHVWVATRDSVEIDWPAGQRWALKPMRLTAN